jgi:hypothetical protein
MQAQHKIMAARATDIAMLAGEGERKAGATNTGGNG